jgi:hypothetical protein
VVTPPADQRIVTTSSNGAIVNYPAATAHDVVGVTSLTYSQASGTVFPNGTTVVTVTARDAANNTGTATFEVTVIEEHDLAGNGDAATGISGAVFSTLGNPAMNDQDYVALGAKVSGSGVSSSSNLGIWADDYTGTRQLVVRTGTTAPDAAGAATSAVFKKFSDPVYSGSNAVAFIGTLTQGGGGVTAANDTGVWSNDGGTLHLVAREGVQAPGCGAGVVFKTFTQIALPDQGGVVMFAKLGGTGVTSASDMGIWAVDTGGTLQLIAREGTAHAVTGKTIKTLSFLPTIAGVSGQTRGFSQSTGDLVYSATFTDGSAGIFKVVFP